MVANLLQTTRSKLRLIWEDNFDMTFPAVTTYDNFKMAEIANPDYPHKEIEKQLVEILVNFHTCFSKKSRNDK